MDILLLNPASVFSTAPTNYQRLRISTEPMIRHGGSYVETARLESSVVNILWWLCCIQSASLAHECDCLDADAGVPCWPCYRVASTNFSNVSELKSDPLVSFGITPLLSPSMRLIRSIGYTRRSFEVYSSSALPANSAFIN